ncbi:hypothetical protein [Thiolapillus sp.]|uniref:hypothetical protein n=5 Tax=Thiolapillus sp. TaxID=2017437 RepID=UPI0025FE215C|nr:hypothetical protein [Thiolapillus sp.]
MIFLRLNIDNIYMFKEAAIDFTYPRRLASSLIEGEYMAEFPQVRFKRVCIIMGPNASGKTSLGRIMCSINNYLQGKPIAQVCENIFDKSKPATIELLYVLPELKELRRLRIEVDAKGVKRETLWGMALHKSDSLEKMVMALDKSEPVFHWDREEQPAIGDTDNVKLFSPAAAKGVVLDHASGWHYIFSEMDVSSGDLVHDQQDLVLLEKVLCAFDGSIDSVSPSQDKDNAYVIAFNNDDRVIVEDGQLRSSDRQRLSRGTLESIEVAKLLATIIRQGDIPNVSSTFFLDEKMAYSHTEMEAAILNVMIEKMGRYSQLFYTTHNHDILSMALPSHSYLFMYKDDFVRFAQPEKMKYSKNDRKLLGYVRNDIFGTVPDTSLIDALLD